ncbi:hypothetical protein TIFTF001_016858 [Ficus carica]|uniref:Uncharacterized protein n=1 Tax=Ficus carica TaxID=3494 RepID=A0AA88D6K2_FICCA|nr:hypothetical protein TIFTF001_016858 [Ficus carica]
MIQNKEASSAIGSESAKAKGIRAYGSHTQQPKINTSSVTHSLHHLDIIVAQQRGNIKHQEVTINELVITSRQAVESPFISLHQRTLLSRGKLPSGPHDLDINQIHHQVNSHQKKTNNNEEQLSFASSCKAITSNKLIACNTRSKSPFQLNKSPIDSSFMARSSNIGSMSIGDMLTFLYGTSTDSNQRSSSHQSH